MREDYTGLEERLIDALQAAYHYIETRTKANGKGCILAIIGSALEKALDK